MKKLECEICGFSQEVPISEQDWEQFVATQAKLSSGDPKNAHLICRTCQDAVHYAATMANVHPGVVFEAIENNKETVRGFISAAKKQSGLAKGNPGEYLH